MTASQPAIPQAPGDQTATGDQEATPTIAFLGTGRMGGPMAANLARAGFTVQAWNRTASRADPLADDGATVVASPAEAVKGAGILITMLADGPAIEQLWQEPAGLAAAAPGLIWVQMGTVGIEWTRRLADTAAKHGLTFVDAPVSGSEGPALSGELVILASGPDQAREVLAPVFAALGKATTWLGPAGDGTQAKLVLNNWLADITETTAETMSFARSLGVDPAAILDLLDETRSGRRTRRRRPGPCWPAISPRRSRSNTRSRTPSLQPRPRRPAGRTWR
jgi:3-hydroxyisobutyrate dehydrogenase